MFRQFSNGGGLAGTIDTNDQDHKGLRIARDVQWRFAGLQNIREPRAQRRQQRLGIVEFMSRNAAVEVAQNLLRRGDADVGANQPSLKFFEQCGVDLAALHQAANLARQRRTAAIQARAQASQKPLWLI